MTLFICPVCGKPLETKDSSLVCSGGHCYDIARAGYVNLLMSNQSGAKRHGDDALMVGARASFLARGHYAPLLEAVCETALGCVEGCPVIVDAGCGEGYYTAGLSAYLAENGIAAGIAGIDISRDALRRAARRDENLQLAVASVFHMPVASKSADLILSIFAPVAPEQFRRILKPEGSLLCVVPLERHLWGLKQAVYDKPRLNPPEPKPPEGFRLEAGRDVRYRLSLSGEEARELFAMTPYMYKTGERDQAKLAALDSLETEVEFGIRVYSAQ